MDLFKKIAEHTEEKVTIHIKKKENGTLVVMLQQDELPPFSHKGLPEQLDELFTDMYHNACLKLKDSDAEAKDGGVRGVTSNVEEVVKQEKEESLPNKKSSSSKSSSKSTKDEPKKEEPKADPLKAFKDKLAKVKAADKKKVDETVTRLKDAKDESMVSFLTNQLKTILKGLKFEEKDIDAYVATLETGIAKGGGTAPAPAPAATPAETAGSDENEDETEMVDIQEEGQAAPWEGPKNEATKPAEPITPPVQPVPTPAPSNTQESIIDHNQDIGEGLLF